MKSGGRCRVLAVSSPGSWGDARLCSRAWGPKHREARTWPGDTPARCSAGCERRSLSLPPPLHLLQGFCIPSESSWVVRNFPTPGCRVKHSNTVCLPSCLRCRSAAWPQKLKPTWFCLDYTYSIRTYLRCHFKMRPV